MREKVEKPTYAVYLDDTATIETRILVEACHRLEKSGQWFPKVSELLEACRLVAKEEQIRREANRKRLPAPDEPDATRKAMWMAKIRAICQGKRMPQ